MEKSGQLGKLVANDFRGAIVRAQFADRDPTTGKTLDYDKAAKALEAIRTKYQHAGLAVRIIGFAKAVGDIGDGMRGVVHFFGVAFLLTVLFLYLYNRSWGLTWRALACACLPVLWLAGIMPLLGIGIDPLSILVPYLVFTIGVSHAVQMTRAWQRACRVEPDGMAAARNAFCTLFLPGALALLTNALGFMVIMFIDIEIVHELDMTASIAVALMIVTNKIFLPIVLSYAPMPQRRTIGPARSHAAWAWCAASAGRQAHLIVILLGLGLGMAAIQKGQQLQIGDPGRGLPELFSDARYNRDNAAIVSAFSIGVDVLSIIVRGKQGEMSCIAPDVAAYVDRFASHMAAVAGVQSVVAYPAIAAMVNAGLNEGSLKWHILSENPQVLAQAVNPLIASDAGLISRDCKVMQVMVFTKDHSSSTIDNIIAAVETFQRANRFDGADLLLASGNVGVMAATNQAVAAAAPRMLGALFAALALLCLLTFRTLGAPVVILLPLLLVSLLCHALMATLDIGLKVATLPVVTLGVGVAVDYAIYLYHAMQQHRRSGDDLVPAVEKAMRERGGAILFTAVTMSIGVGSWYFSSLKFQSDMGLLLAFMFLVNVAGALFLMPALAALIDTMSRAVPDRRRLFPAKRPS